MLARQLPLIQREFSEIAHCQMGTINVELDEPLLVRVGDHRTQPVEWAPGIGAEVFDLVRVTIRLPRRGTSHRAWLYVPHRSPHRRTPRVHELIAPPLDLSSEREIEIVIDRGFRREVHAAGEILVVS